MINVYQPTLGKEELEALEKVFESNWLGKGKRVAEFEEKYRKAELRSKLPDNPDMARIEAFVEKINRRVVLGEFL